MLLRVAMLSLGLLLSDAITAAEKPRPPLTLICPVQTNWTRLLAADGAFDGPPAINTLINNVINGKLPQVRQQLDAMNLADAARWRQSALVIAAYAREPAMVDGLLDDGALVDGQGRLPGVDGKSRDRVIAQMKKDPQWTSVDPDLRARLEGGPTWGAALLFDSRVEGPLATIAAQCGDLATLDVALNHHANLKTRIPHSNDVMVMAVQAGNPVIVKRLLDHGADPTSAPTGSADGLAAAIVEGNSAMVTLMLDHGADPCVEDRSRQRSHAAYQARHPGQKRPLVSAAEIARRKNLPHDLVVRFTCPGFDTASAASH
jgi:hypothetical protein